MRPETNPNQAATRRTFTSSLVGTPAAIAGSFEP